MTDARCSGPRPSAAIAALFPQGVAAAELFGPANDDVLTEAEARCCANFGAKRLADFAAGRACAHRVLDELSHPEFSLLVDGDRRPRWPAGVVGSISHTDGYCGVAAATTDRVRSLGFDVERVGRITPDLWSKLFTALEIEWLETLSGSDRALAATLLFSAKEAFYKCRFHVDSEWLDFTDVEVAVETFGASGRFSVRLTRDVSHENVFDAGRFFIAEGMVLTGISLL